jgi:N-dimethylarginine dimethylaminohydrolase
MTVNRLKEKMGEQRKLVEQLERYAKLKEKHGIDAHEIRSFRLVPYGYDEAERFNSDHKNGVTELTVLYGSVVTMKDGRVISLPRVNIKQLLDGEGE